jgi:hypothetical protein
VAKAGENKKVDGVVVRYFQNSEGGFGIAVRDRDHFLKNLNREFGVPPRGEEILIEATFEELKVFKTLPQMGYYRAEIQKKCAIGLTENGWNGVDEDIAHEFLKRRFFAKNMVNPETGEVFEDAKSLADASKEEMSEFIDNCIVFIETELGTYIQSPEEWLEEQRKKREP